MSLAAAGNLPPPFFALHFRLRPVGRPDLPAAALVLLACRFRRLFSRSTPVSCRPPRLSSRCRRFPVPARQNIVSVPSCRHRAGRFLTPSAAFPACTSAVSFSHRPQDGKYKYLFRRNSPSGRHGLAGNLLFLHRFERFRCAGIKPSHAGKTKDRIQLKTFR